MIRKIIYIAIVLAIAVFIVFKLKSNKENSEKRVYQYDKEKPVNVQTLKVSFGIPENEYVYSGTFEPEKESKISADFQGKVNGVFVGVGSYVKKGQTLIQLDNALLKLQLQSTEIQIEGLETDVKRFTVLAQADAIQGVQLEKAELGLKTAKVQKATLLEQIKKTSVIAPFSGFITAKLTEEGAFAAPGMPLIQITDISTLNFTIHVPENKLAQFHAGQTFPVSADVYPGLSLTGKVVMVGSKANPGNSYPVQLAVKNTNDSRIKSGMFGKVRVKTGRNEKRIAVPASVVVGNGIQPQIYVVKNDRARLQNITISERLEDKIIISEGISDGDRIVTSGFINLFDGASVTLK